MSEAIKNQNSILYAAYVQFVNLSYIAANKIVFEGRSAKKEDQKIDELCIYLDAWQHNGDYTDEQKENILYALLQLAQPLTTAIMATTQPLLGNQIIYELENPPVSEVDLPYRVWAPRGYFSAAAGLWPSTGGTGSGGAIEEGNTWDINAEGTLGGTLVVVGATIRALTDNPGQSSGNWKIEY